MHEATHRSITLPFRVLWLIILAWSLIRLVIVIVVPKEASSFAPDEETYADLIRAVASGQDWRTWGTGWGAFFWPQGRALVLPASVLTSWSIDPILSLRLVSFAYATGSAVLLVCLLWIGMRRGRFASDAPGPKLASWPIVGLLVFLLLPSHALWNFLALREAATEFWAISAVTLCAVLFYFMMSWWQKALVGAGIAISLSLTFQSRGYMAVALTFALLAGVLWFGRERPRVSVTLAISVLAGTIAGLLLSMPSGTAQDPSTARGADLPGASIALAAAVERERAAAEVLTALGTSGGNVEEARALLETLPSERQEGTEALLDRAATEDDPLQAAQLLESVAAQRVQALRDRTAPADGPGRPSGPLTGLREGVDHAQSVLNPDSYFERGSQQREIFGQYANSALAISSCAAAADPLDLRLCELARLPGAALAVMFRPLWPLDQPTEWSGLAVAANVENVVWIALVLVAIALLVTHRTRLPRVMLMAAAYALILVAGMGVMEGNLGTAFRHKSSVLWVLCLTLILVGPLRDRMRFPVRRKSAPMEHEPNAESAPISGA